MSLSPSQTARHPVWSALTWVICALSLGLLIWRGMELPSAPAATSTHPAAAVIEPVVGEGNFRIGETAQGGLLILLNGPDGETDPATLTQLSELVQALKPQDAPPIFRHVLFAAKPGPRAVAELIILGLIAGLSTLLAIVIGSERPANAPLGARASRVSPHDTKDSHAIDQSEASTPPPFDAGPRPIAANHDGPAGADPAQLKRAKRFAEDNPDVTANVIEGWIRTRGFQE